MLKVPIDKIIPVTDARANISKVMNDVESGDIYVLTRGGKPSAVIAPISYIKQCDSEDIRKTKIMSDNNSEKPVRQNNHLIDTSDLHDLQTKKNESNKVPAVFDEKSKDLVQEDAKQVLPDNYKKQETELVKADDEESVPIKVTTGSWN